MDKRIFYTLMVVWVLYTMIFIPAIAYIFDDADAFAGWVLSVFGAIGIVIGLIESDWTLK